MHFLLDQLSKINNGEPAIDQLLNAQLFGIKIDWYGHIIDYFKKGYFDDDMPKKEWS